MALSLHHIQRLMTLVVEKLDKERKKRKDPIAYQTIKESLIPIHRSYLAMIKSVRSGKNLPGEFIRRVIELAGTAQKAASDIGNCTSLNEEKFRQAELDKHCD